MRQLGSFNRELKAVKESVLSGECEMPELGIAVPAGLAERLRESWLRSLGSGLDATSSSFKKRAVDLRRTAAFEPGYVRFVTLVLDQTSDALADLPVILVLLDTSHNVLISKRSSVLSNDPWGEAAFSVGCNLNEATVGTCAHSLLSASFGTATLVGAMHYLEAFEDMASAAEILLHEGSKVGYIAAFARLDADSHVEESVINRISGCLKMAATASQSELNAIANNSHGRLVGDVLNESIAYTDRGIVVLDAGGCVRAANPKACKILGVSKDNAASLASVRISAGRHDLIQIMRAGKAKNNIDLTFGVGASSVMFRSDIRPILSRDKSKLIGACLLMRSYDRFDAEGGRILSFDDLRGTGKRFLKAKRMAVMTSSTNEAVLITGNIGTGKKALSRAMHLERCGDMSSYALVDCSTGDVAELEAQLFGYVDPETGEEVRGAYHKANGGTLVLDNIEELPLRIQGAIMRALELRAINVPGKKNKSSVYIKLVAISKNVDFYELMRQGKFREDLFYRISSVHITLPDLKERSEDVLELASCFMSAFCEEFEVSRIAFSGKAKKALTAFSWPGNIIQLRYYVRHACYSCDEGVIDLSCLPSALVEEVGLADQIKDVSSEVDLSMESARRERVIDALRETEGNVAQAAKLLGVSRATFYRWKKEAEAGAAQ